MNYLKVDDYILHKKKDGYMTGGIHSIIFLKITFLL